MSRSILCALMVGVAIGLTARETASLLRIAAPAPHTALVRPVTLEEIFKQKGTDKFHRHGYFRFYDPHFRHLQDAPVTLLEIGADHGASINSWSTYFTNRDARILGIAFRVIPSSHPQDVRVKILLGDQNNCTLLRRIVQEVGRPFDIIIDDGSHHPDHQLRSFLALFPSIRPGGLYIIEDIETSYWDAQGASIYGYSLDGVGVGSPISIVERAKMLVEVLNQRYFTRNYQANFSFFSSRVDPLVESITFAQNILLFRRKTNTKFDQSLDNMADGHTYDLYRSSTRVEELIRRARECVCERQ